MNTLKKFSTPISSLLVVSFIYGGIFVLITSVGNTSALALINTIGLGCGVGGAVAYYMWQQFTVGNGLLVAKVGLKKNRHSIADCTFSVSQVACRGG